MDDLSILQLREKLDSKELSAIDLAEHYLNRILETNDTLNSFITVDTEHVREHAKHAQAEIDNGNQSRLTGIPYAAKDLFCTKGVRTTAGSHILNEYVPPYSATVINRLRDGVLLGKTNMDEFAMGASTEYSAYGPTKNPYDLERVPGGSSGGSAVAVAAGQAPFALGTDTCGSTRQPASFCNVVGLKPTYGRISRYGVVALASSLDTVGIFARSVEDAAVVLEQIAGEDALDATTPSEPIDDYLSRMSDDISKMRVGIPKEFIEMDGFDPEVKESFERTVELLAEIGATIEEVSLPHTRYAVPAYYILCPSEASSNLARYDGIQYGKPSPDAKTLEEVFLKTREQGFGPEAKRRIMIGTFCLSSGYFDAYYKKAQQVRTLIREDFDEAYTKVDVLLAPTAPTLPFKLGEKSKDPIAMYLSDIFTGPASLAGVPTISVPSGFVQDLPVGVQFIGPQFGESKILAAARALEQAVEPASVSLAV
ncbi:MAG: Asp-tRNA(Asn)/Glu-tRNA(Gln) amidotransferase subunit GatA [Candidatus Kerfeldbacteria bacterium]